jgi:glycosyltransferase involved in cell wall biosynthesis
MIHLNRHPSVDVVIPAYNAARFIGETINSVLAQSYQPNSIIVVDDGSIDNTAEVVKNLDGNIINLIAVKNGGVSRARNIGIRASSADYIAFLDSDDIWLPDKLRLQVDVLQRDTYAKVVYSGASLIDDVSQDIPDSIGIPYIKGDVFEDILLFERPIYGSASSVMVERATLNRTGLFDESMRFSEDVDLWARLALIAKFTFVDCPIVKIRVHNTSATRLDCWEKEKQIILQHFYYVNKFVRDRILPDENLQIHRRRVLRLLLSRNARAIDYFTFYEQLKEKTPHLCEQLGGNIITFSAHLLNIILREVCIRVKDRMLFRDRLKLLLTEGTVLFSRSKNYCKDVEFHKRRK